MNVAKLLLLTISLSILIASCGNSNDGPHSQSDTLNAATATPAAPPPADTAANAAEPRDGSDGGGATTRKP